MNLLEQYIKEIHSEKPYCESWTKHFPGIEFVEVDITTVCYGREKRNKKVFNTVEWLKYKTEGYFMA